MNQNIMMFIATLILFSMLLVSFIIGSRNAIDLQQQCQQICAPSRVVGTTWIGTMAIWDNTSGFGDNLNASWFDNKSGT